MIANLALYFAVHTLFSETRTVGRAGRARSLPVWSSYVWEALLVAAVALRAGLPAPLVGPADAGRLRVLGLALTAVA